MSVTTYPPQPTLQFLRDRVNHHLERIYADVDEFEISPQLGDELLQIMGISDDVCEAPQHRNLWDQQDVFVICYGDSLLAGHDIPPLEVLQHFLETHSDGLLGGVHILPFFPWSSDDGFAVLDYSSVNESLGTWHDIEAISERYDLMADLVINHCSSRSLWFQNYLQGKSPGKDFFYEADPDADLGAVVRPRTSPLLKKVETVNGEKHVWCTFGHDQVDLNFRNPEVLKQMVSIIRFYLERGVRVFRLDAVAFLWKIPGTSCLNLEETHEIVRLLRVLIEHWRCDAILITETNIPNRENLSYFGNANEAHCVYNFSLPPLLVNTLITGNCNYLRQWLMSLPPAQNGTAYFNFIASHDGIGLRPTEGILSDREISALIETMEAFGGRVSYRALDNGVQKPYEINISLFDALQGTVHGKDSLGMQRFLCAHAIMLALEGIPAIYIHSLLGTRNDYARMEHAGHNRAINRHQWDYGKLETALADPDSDHCKVFEGIKRLVAIRREQPAFHPNATQFTLQLGRTLVGFWRQSMDRRQSIFCVSNVARKARKLALSDLNLIETDQWVDLVSGEALEDIRGYITIEPYQTLWICN